MASFFIRTLAIILIIPFFNIAFANTTCRCEPDQACWPTKEVWENLQKKLTGKLVKPILPIQACKIDTQSKACKLALKNMHNPFYLGSHPGATQSQGWLNAWENQPSIYAVEAANTADVVAGVNFAREHNLRLVIKGAGHDYLGRSSAPNSLLIWTHKMRDIKMEKSFVPTGCDADEKSIPAVTVSAGTRWIEAYGEVTTKNHRYVQGGGCTTVGAAGGFTQGSGFGSWSKKFGTGAGGVLQAEIVTADGKVLIANHCQNKDLFWAIRGGGGGTFGIVTKMTLRTHPLPKNFGVFEKTITATNDEAYRQLLPQFLIFLRSHLVNEHWGEQISFDKNNIKIFMVFQNLTEQQIKKTWEPLENWIQKHHDQYTVKTQTVIIPPKQFWNVNYWKKNHPHFVTLNTTGKKGEYWWANNSGEVSAYWYSYQSWWLPDYLLRDENIDKLAKIFFAASRLTNTTLHLNKGLTGASETAIKLSHETAINPNVFNAVGLIIMGSSNSQVYPGIKNLAPNMQEATTKLQIINQAMQLFRQAAPEAGTYENEADYFEPDWQNTFWGKNYARLLTIKKQYDPDGLFYCHHCVGSELRTENGMCLK